MEDKRIEALYPADSWEIEIEQILALIKRGQSVQLVGIPGSGRSDLLGLLSYNRNVRIKHLGEDEQVKYHFVLINFSEIKDLPNSEVFKFIFLSLIDSLRLRNILTDPDSKKELEIASSIFKNSIATGDSLIIFNALKRTLDFLCLERDLTIIFLFDRFEEYIPKVYKEFFTNLRALRNRAKYKFSAVFSLTRPLEDILEPEIYSDFAEFLQGNIIYLPLSDKPSLDFKIDHFQKISEKEVSQKTIDNVLKITAGHSRLSRLCLEKFEIFNSKFARLQLPSQSDGGQEMNDLIFNTKINKGLLDIWNSLIPEESAFIKNFGETKQIIPEYLLNVGLMNNPSTGSGRIAIPLFAKFVQRVEMKPERFIYDSQTKEIKKGNVILSNGLTSLEFKLFKTLLENEGKVLSRDDIVASVWGDLKSTQGVTDQAIDQLIFRLRKKIEENPASPKLIQTIKGRGLSFSQ